MFRVLAAGVMLAVQCNAAKENPIRKIVRLMQDMSAEIEAEKKKEAELYEKLMCVCTEYPPELTASIEAGKSSIASLTGKIEEETALKAKLAEEIKGHGADKEAATKDLAKATTLREKESEEYDGSVADLKGSIGQLDSAIPALEAGAGSSALMQAAGSSHLKNVIQSSSAITDFDKKRVLAFLNEGDSESDSSLESAAAPGSGEILGILKAMKDDMAKSVTEAEDSEQVASAGFADLKAAKDEEIALAASAIESKDKKTGDLAMSLASSSEALEDTEEELADNQKMLKTLVDTCDSKKLEFQERLKLRNDEIAAISEAVGILNDDDALDVFKKAVPAAMVETEAQSGFLQTKNENKLKQAVEIVRAASKKNSDMHLSMLLQQMSSKLRSAGKHGDAQAPDFGAVSKMIDDMVSVLSKEGAEDMKKKDWCVTELHKAEGDLSTKQEAMDGVVATISQVEDEVSGLAEDITALQTSIADLDKEVSKATETRKAEHAEYSESLQLSEAAVALIAKAKNRLAKFYNPTVYKAPPKVEKTMEDKIIAAYGAFVQKHASHHRGSAKQPEIPELPAYSKKNSGGVIALMDSIALDLQKDSADAAHDEKTAQSEYVSLMAESQESRAGYLKTLTNTNSAKAELEKKLVTAKEEKQISFEELNNAHTFLGDLHSTCDFVVSNFDMRAQARETELESLKSAKAVLAGATFF
jgi:hypothetical protein